MLAEENLQEELKVIELDWFGEGETVSVTPRNQQRFEIQKDHAIEVLLRASSRERFNLQFKLLLDLLAQWIQTHQAKISHAYLTLSEGALQFVVIRNQVRYDEDFEDELASFDLRLARDTDLDLITLRTLALPAVEETAIRSFLDQRMILSYGKRS